ncbi:MAG TPA: FecR domain-containing protein [Mucilaginibacter sp.]
MEEKDIKKLLDKYNAGKCTDDELALLQTLMREFDREQGLPAPKPELKQAVWEQIENRTINQGRVRKLNTVWLKIAAAVLIFGMAGIFYSRFTAVQKDDHIVAYQVISAPHGKMRNVVLPDNTVVQLNAGTTLKFPVKFSQSRREVTLLGGEAYFEVQHEAARPFLVHTAGVTTQVLGTSFNIKFYKELPFIQVFVNTGKVEVHDRKHTLGMYTPQQQLTYNKSSQTFTRQQIAGDHSLSWMHDELILDDVSFKEVSVYLQNRYNVNFIYRRKKLGQQHYSVRFSNKLTINQVLDILQLIDGRQYSLQNDTVIIK